MTETERSFLATKSFNTNLVHVLPLYYVLISNLHVCPLPGFSLLGWVVGDSPPPPPTAENLLTSPLPPPHLKKIPPSRLPH